MVPEAGPASSASLERAFCTIGVAHMKKISDTTRVDNVSMNMQAETKEWRSHNRESKTHLGNNVINLGQNVLERSLDVGGFQSRRLDE